tara:strand:- start:367 stop:492 length:126 start_codon:yes stop_codon:yes gene_type:complete
LFSFLQQIQAGVGFTIPAVFARKAYASLSGFIDIVLDLVVI